MKLGEEQNAFETPVPEEEGRKLFANKKANIALIIAGAVIAVAIIGCLIFINIPIG